MGQITINGIQDGTLAKAADVNERIATVVGVINGNIEASNIKNGTITSANLAPNSVSNANLQTGSVTRDKLAGSITTITSASIITPDAQIYIVTALANDATIAPPTGTPYSGQPLLLRMKASGADRALSWNAVYRGIGVTLPTTITSGQVIYAGGRYNLEDAKWDIIGIGRS